MVMPRAQGKQTLLVNFKICIEQASGQKNIAVQVLLVRPTGDGRGHCLT